ncbi:DNA-3-methyladenine glycosylase I [Acuticoccus sp. MNP-M23]|uniref:DNA-3-methyladenine glycosylase I n=1 Tax=Acuticoccus sp. MNP-M23 TaxID=3072793 RepID=UPI0028154E27|nr:DNA-3-methyladenine glycosylase I [Acuticoccus sp. MNP-M23]WMS44115.1 DNA-3-methyladenine glycosylase I [Acuticoccus sp. MNP-M23]
MADDRAARTGLTTAPDGKPRCAWHGGQADYVAYHDVEWARPVGSDTRLFEKICLEGFQSGLSWLTILRKRENFRRAFAGFDIETVSAFGEADVARLLADAGIVRHRGKIEAAINNARAAARLIEAEGSLAGYLWRHEPEPMEAPASWEALSARSIRPEAAALSKDLKKRGWRFVGPTTMTALFQAAGLVNDHIEGCICRASVEAARAEFVRPG